MERHALLLPFDTDDPEFARGFEVGRMWEQLRQPDAPPVVVLVIHATNLEMLLRIGEAVGRHVTIDDVDSDDAWVTATLAEPRE